MTDLIADLNRIRAGACRHVLHGDMPADPAELATVCRLAVEALTPPEDVGELRRRVMDAGYRCAGFEEDEHMNACFEAADRLSTLSAALALVTRERDVLRDERDEARESAISWHERASPKPLDPDVKWLLGLVSDDAELSSDINGENDPATKNSRRIEVTVRRLAREAGYQFGGMDIAALTPGRGADESGEAGDA